jgi:uncharacterized protein YoxC
VNRQGLPVALLALAVFLGLVFQTVQLVRDSETLATIDRSQDVPLQDTARMRQATDALASDIVQLAQSGNAGAKQVLDEMAKQNIVLRFPPATPAAPAPAPDAPH